MSSDKLSTERQWRLAIAMLEARVEELKVRSEAEYRFLHSRLDEQIAELQAELKKLAAEVAAAGPDAYVQSISAQLEELKAKGDAAYDLLRATLAAKGLNGDRASN